MGVEELERRKFESAATLARRVQDLLDNDSWNLIPNSIPFPGNRQYDLIIDSAQGNRFVVDVQYGDANLHVSELAQAETMASELVRQDPNQDVMPVILTTRPVTSRIRAAASAIGIELIEAEGRTEDLARVLADHLERVDGLTIPRLADELQSLLSAGEFRRAKTEAVTLTASGLHNFGLRDRYSVSRGDTSVEDEAILHVAASFRTRGLALTLGPSEDSTVLDAGPADEVQVSVVDPRSDHVLGTAVLDESGSALLKIRYSVEPKDLVLRWEIRKSRT